MAGSPELYWGGCTGARGIRCTGGGRVGSECPSKVRDSSATGDGVREGGGGEAGVGACGVGSVMWDRVRLGVIRDKASVEDGCGRSRDGGVGCWVVGSGGDGRVNGSRYGSETG